MPDSVSNRGFAQYKDGVKVRHNAIVRVNESSNAMQRCMWIRINGEAHLRDKPFPFAGIPHGIAQADMAAECTVPQARAIYEGIGEFLGETLEIPDMDIDSFESWLQNLEPEDFIKAISIFAKTMQSYVEELTA